MSPDPWPPAKEGPDALPRPGALLVEPIVPEAEAFDAVGAAPGEPALPLRFSWRGRTFVLANVLRRWRTTGPMRGGGSERYVRRHWAVVRTHDGLPVRIYGERSGRGRRWWLHSIEPEGPRGTGRPGPAREAGP